MVSTVSMRILPLRLCGRSRNLVLFTVVLAVVVIYTVITESKQRERSTADRLQGVSRAESKYRSVAIMGTDITYHQLTKLSREFEYLFIVPHATKGIHPFSESSFIDHEDKTWLGILIEFLQRTKHHGGTCMGTRQNHHNNTTQGVTIKKSCYHEKKNSTLLIGDTRQVESEIVRNRAVQYMKCNILERAFLIRRVVFEYIYFNPAYGETVLLDFFLRSKSKLKMAGLLGCSFSGELNRYDRGALNGNHFFTDYIKLGSYHKLVRIVRENEITWTKCSYHVKRCPEKPLDRKKHVSLPRQLLPVCCSEVLDTLLVDVVHEMNAVGLDYRVVYGTLLGAVRSGAIIPWTRDVDIGLQEQDYFKKQIFDKLGRILKAKNYALTLVKGQRRVIPLFPPRRLVQGSPFDIPFQKQLFSKNVVREIRRLQRAKTRWQDLGYLDFYIANQTLFQSLTTVEINGNKYATLVPMKEMLVRWYGQEYMKGNKKQSAPMEIDIGKRRKQIQIRNRRDKNSRKPRKKNRMAKKRKTKKRSNV